MKKGRLYLILSAVIYGFIPILTKQVSISGGDSVTTVFLRSVLSLPLLLLMIYKKKINLKLSWREFWKIVVLGAGGFAPSMVLLYASYARSAVGVATMLHFIYPFVIVLVCAVFFHERMPKWKWVGTVIAAVGVLLSLDMKSEAVGAVLAALSGLFYAFFVIFMDKSGIDGMNYLKLTFYLSLIMAAASLVMCLIGDGIRLPTDLDGWIAAIFISGLTTIFAIPLFQLGVKYEGASEAGILSMAEPVCGIILGAVLLSEQVTVTGIIGCIMMGIGIVCVEKA